MSWSAFFWMRSAGFPFAWLLDTAVLQSSKEFTRYESLHDELSVVESALMALARRLCPAAFPKLIRRFSQGERLAASDLPPALRDAASQALAARMDILAGIQGCEEAVRVAFDAEATRARLKLVDFVRDPQVREAIFLSNPDALERIDSLTSRDTLNLDSRTRQRLRLSWNYLQRLCAKNDTASFFGPIAWGRFGGIGTPDIDLRRQDGHWLTVRETFIEHWVVMRLAHAISQDVALRNALPIGLSQSCHLSGDTLHFPLHKSRALNEPMRTLLSYIVAAGPSGTSRTQLRHAGVLRDQTEPLLDSLLRNGVLVQGLSFEPGRAGALACMTRSLRALTVSASSIDRWIDVLDRLESARVRFAEGDLNQRASALNAMREILVEAGIDQSREQGQMYVGRFPVYEDCERNVLIHLGGQVRDALRQPMGLVMELYEWLVGAAAVRLHDRYLVEWQALARLCTVSATSNDELVVDFLQLCATMQSTDHAPSVIDELRIILRNSWHDICAQRGGGGEIELTSADLHRLLANLHRQEPRASSSPELSCGVQSPDFMIAAANEGAFRGGDFTLIIGEVHPGVHTVSQPVAQPFCPFSDEIRAELCDVLGEQALVIADSQTTYQRSHIDWLDVPSLVRVRLPTSGVPQEPSKGIPAGGADVVLRRGRLMFRSSDRQLEEDLLTVLPTTIHRVCFALAADVLGQSRQERLVVGRVVIKRRSWQLQPADLPVDFGSPDSLEGFVAWRRWARRLDLPRHVFVKSDAEPKPVYVDFNSPQSIDLLATLSKKLQPMRLSEMRPAPDELWMQDERGVYCNEFRTSFARSRHWVQARARTHGKSSSPAMSPTDFADA